VLGERDRCCFGNWLNCCDNDDDDEDDNDDDNDNNNINNAVPLGALHFSPPPRCPLDL